MPQPKIMMLMMVKSKKNECRRIKWVYILKKCMWNDFRIGRSALMIIENLVELIWIKLKRNGTFCLLNLSECMEWWWKYGKIVLYVQGAYMMFMCFRVPFAIPDRLHRGSSHLISPCNAYHRTGKTENINIL